MIISTAIFWIGDILSIKSFFFDRALLLAILVIALFILWWLTADFITALICLGTLIIISIVARLHQPWNEEKVIEKLNIQNQKKTDDHFTENR